MITFGQQFIAAVVMGGDTSALYQHGDIEHLFRASDLKAWRFVLDFAKKHGKTPTASTLKINTGDDYPSLKAHTPEPAGYYLDLLRSNHIEVTLKKAITEALIQHLGTENKDPQAALSMVLAAALELQARAQASTVLDFRDMGGALVQDYASAFNEEDTGLQLGWPTIDTMSGGLGKGDVYSMVGRPAAGKTFQLLYAAMHGWRASAPKNPEDEYADPIPGGSRLLVSMEMPPIEIAKRMAAMEAKLPLKHLYNTTFTTPQLGKFKSTVMGVSKYGNPFWIVDGNLKATVEEIWGLAVQLKPDAIFIDGGYLLKHPTERDRFRRVAENADLIKQELAALAPTVVTWQFAKSAAQKGGKKQSAENAVTMEDIGYTDAIAQVSSLVTGLFQPESAETVRQRIVRILKGRKGETGEISCNWNFDNMDFSELVEPDLADVGFV